MCPYQFDDHSCSDNIVIATLAMPVVDESYQFLQKKYPDIYIRNRGLAHHLAFVPEDSDEVKAVREAVDEYNEYLTKLEAIPGFVEYFKEHGFCVSKGEVVKQWSEEIADFVFSKKSYCFDTELRIIHDYLFDSSISVMFQATVENCTVNIPIGKPDTAYPDMINGKKAIWNWVDNGHDFCLKLWMLLGERESQNEESLEDEDAVHYDFDAYDQFRHDYVEPQLVNVFKKLESLGYKKSYTIKPEHEDPRWVDYGKTDGTIDLALVDLSFKDDKECMDQIELLLWQRVD